MSSDDKPKSKGFADNRKYAVPEAWKDKERFHDMPPDWNAPRGKDLDKFRIKRKGQMADISWDMLEFEELPVSSAPLISAGQFIGVACRKENQDFLVCKRQTQDPRSCLDEGKIVSNCAREFLMKVRDNCRAEFRKHWTCMDQSNLAFADCRKFQFPFDQCVLESTGLERPEPPARGKVLPYQ